MDDRLIRELEALRVKPGEVLIIRVPTDILEPGDASDAMAQLREALDEVGLAGRALVIAAAVEMTVAERED